MSDNVRKLTVPPPAPDAGIVELLETILNRAKRGEIVSMVAAFEVAGKNPLLARSTGADTDYYRLMGALVELQSDLKEWHTGETSRTETCF